MADMYITVHSTQHAAQAWAAQLPSYGQHLIAIQGPIQNVQLDNHRDDPPANVCYLEVPGSWVVLADG